MSLGEANACSQDGMDDGAEGDYEYKVRPLGNAKKNAKPGIVVDNYNHRDLCPECRNAKE